MRPTSCLTGAWRCEVPIRADPAPARWASCSGRTFDGPQPKRPSAGLIAGGIWSGVGVAFTGVCTVANAPRTPPAGDGLDPQDEPDDVEAQAAVAAVEVAARRVLAQRHERDPPR